MFQIVTIYFQKHHKGLLKQNWHLDFYFGIIRTWAYYKGFVSTFFFWMYYYL